MQQLTITRSGNIGTGFARLRESYREIRAGTLNDAADRLKRALDGNILASGLNDTHGRVRAWQTRYDGSFGGYTAIRAVSGATGADSPSAITNYLENGHKVRYPTGKSNRYRPDVHTARARAFRFYHQTVSVVQQIEVDAVQRVEQALAHALEE